MDSNTGMTLKKFDVSKCIICPECKNAHVHLAQVDIIMGDTMIIVKAKDDIRIASADNNQSRGVILRRYYGCEHGCNGFVKQETFHKGTMYKQEGAWLTNSFETIWRD